MASPGGREAGRVSVRVVPDSTRFREDLRRVLERVERTTELKIPVTVDTTALRAKLAAAARDFDIQVSVDLTRVRAALAGLAAELRAFGPANPIQLGIDVNSAAFRAQIASLLRDRTLTVNTVVRGTGLNTVSRLLNGRNRNPFGAVTSGIGELAEGAAKASLVIAGVSVVLQSLTAVTGGLVLGLGQAAQSLALLPALGLAGAAGLGTLLLAFTGLAEAGGAAGRVRDVVMGLKDEFQGLRASVQASFFEDLAAPIQALADDYLPAFRDGLSGIATAFNGGVRGVFEVLRQPVTLADTVTGLENTRQAFANIASAGGPVTAVFRDLAVVGSSFLPELTAGLGAAAQRMADFVAEARASGALREFMQDGITAVGQLGEALGNIGSTFAGLFNAANASGAGFLTSLVGITEALDNLVNSAGAQSGLAAFFSGTAEALRTLLAALGTALPTILASLGPAFATITQAVAGVLAALVAAVTPVIVTLATPIQQLFGILGPAISSLIAAVSPAVSALAGAIAPILTSLATTLAPLIAQIGPVLTTIGQTAAAVFSQLGAALVPIIGTILSALLPALSQVLAAAAPLAVVFAEGIGAALSALAPIIASVVTALAPMVAQFLTALAPALVQIVPLIAELVTTLGTALAPVITAVVAALAPFVAQLVSALVPALAQVLPVVAELAVVLGEALAEALLALAPALPPLAEAFAALIPLLIPIIQLVTTLVSAVVVPALVVVIGALAAVLTTVLPPLTSLIQFISEAAQVVTNYITRGIEWLANMRETMTIVGTLQGAVQRAFSAIQTAVTVAIAAVLATAAQVGAFRDRVVGAFDSLRSSVAERIGQVVETVRALPGRMLAAIGNLAGMFVSVGQDIISGIVSGITSTAGRIASAARAAASTALSAAKGALGISSPSKVFRLQVGQEIGAGMALGIEDSIAQVKHSVSRMASVRPAGGLSSSVLGGVNPAGAVRPSLTVNAYGAREDVLADRVMLAMRRMETLYEVG